MYSLAQVTDFLKELIIDHVPQDIRFYVCGGAIRDALLGEPIKDIDIWCRSEIDFQFLTAWFNTHPNLVGVTDKKHVAEYHVHLKTRIGIGQFKHPIITFQVVKPTDSLTTVRPQDILQNFEFSVNAIAIGNDLNGCYWSIGWSSFRNFDKDELYGQIDYDLEVFLGTLSRKEMWVVHTNKYHVQTLRRLTKMAKKGFFIPTHQLKHIIDSIHNTPLEELHKTLPGFNGGASS